MVAMSIFIVIMLMSSGSILTVFDSNQKSKNLRSVMDNLNVTLESMTRNIRFGANYHCGDDNPPPLADPRDCFGSGSSTLHFEDYNLQQIKYSLVAGQIMRAVDFGANYPLTSDDITVTSLAFRVKGSYPYVNGNGACPVNDCYQPKVIILISGYVGAKETTRSTFTLQTTVSQRKFDFE